jgi:hypothetical protein
VVHADTMTDRAKFQNIKTADLAGIAEIAKIVGFAVVVILGAERPAALRKVRYLNSQSGHNAALDCRRHTTKWPDESAIASVGYSRGNQHACRFTGLNLLTNHHRQSGLLRQPSSCSFSPSSDRWAQSFCEVVPRLRQTLRP